MSKLGNRMIAVLYFALSVVMFYLYDGGFFVGGFGVEYKYLLGIGIIAMALVCFLVTADLRRAIHCAKDALVMMTPFLWTVAYSLVVWVVSGTSSRVMMKGTFYVVYQLIGILVAAGTLYMFGEKGVYMVILSLISAMIVKSLMLVAQCGLDEFVNQYIANILTFTETSGYAMREFEKDGYCYAICFALVYFAMTVKVKKSHALWLTACFFMGFLGLKRSVFLGTLMALFCAFVLKCTAQPRKWINGITLLMMVMVTVYIILVSNHLFDWLETQGIDTSGRDYLYANVREHYEISPMYIGRGIGYVAMSFLNGVIDINQNGFQYGDIHNEYLRQYIDCGFGGYLVWLWLYIAMRVKAFFKTGKNAEENRRGLLCFAMLVLYGVMFMTENCLYYYYATVVMSTAVMGDQFEVFTSETKLPGE